MKQLVSSGPVFWPNGIKPPSVGDVLEAAFRLLQPSPYDFRSSNDRAKALRCRVGIEALRAIFQSAEVRDRSPSFSPTGPDHILGIPLGIYPRCPANAVVFTDEQGHPLHIIVLVDE